MTAHLRPIDFWCGPAGALVLIAAIWLGLRVGTAVGAGGGYVYDQYKEREAAQAEAAQLRQENEQLRQQQGEQQSPTAN
jgi:hypothetical protein